MVRRFNIIYNDLAVYVSIYLPRTYYDLQYLNLPASNHLFKICTKPPSNPSLVSNKPVGWPIFIVHISACWASHMHLCSTNTPIMKPCCMYFKELTTYLRVIFILMLTCLCKIDIYLDIYVDLYKHK